MLHTPSRFALVVAGVLASTTAFAAKETKAPPAAAVAATPVPSPTPDPCAEKIELLQKRLSVAEREAAQAQRKLNELRAEVNDLGPALKDARYQRLVKTVSEQTAQLRGLPLKEPVKPVILDRVGLKKLLDGILATELTSHVVRGETMTWQAFDLLPPDSDIKDLYTKLLEEQVGGLYNERDASLYVVDSFDPKSILGRVLLSHEICHAIQDQNYPIKSLPFHTKNNDQNMAMSAVLEGDATLLMTEWGAENFEPRDILSMREIANQGTEQLNNAPPALVQSMLFPYLAGLKFVTQVIASGGPESRNKPFERPPASTEQILHPEKYLYDNDPPRAVVLPEWTEQDGLKEIYRGVVGEWTTRLILTPPASFPKINFFSADPLVSEPVAAVGAAGWGGDLLLTVASEDNARWGCVWQTEWDSEQDAGEFMTAINRRAAQWSRFLAAEKIASAMSDGSTVMVGVKGDTIEITRSGSRVTVAMGSDKAAFDAVRRTARAANAAPASAPAESQPKSAGTDPVGIETGEPVNAVAPKQP